ncbi:hypothetical protein ONZ45_g16482 [Pleurotus djamor]|nr:hypothetical protein ONZ45_g16482 [Pleurotus djamor]
MALFLLLLLPHSQSSTSTSNHNNSPLMSSPGGVSVTEVQVTCTQPRTLTKKLDITCHYPLHHQNHQQQQQHHHQQQQQQPQPLPIVFQGQTIDGLTYSWKLDPPKNYHLIHIPTTLKIIHIDNVYIDISISIADSEFRVNIIFTQLDIIYGSGSEEGGGLPSTTDELLTICPHGVGKSSLINRIFGVDKATVSDTLPGSSTIDHEITSSANKRFVLHDSQGFEQGESRNLEVVKEFVERRRREPLLKDRLHAIWLCAQIPTTGGRVFESGDVHFLSGLGLNSERSVPVIVVFTKFDLLVRYVDFELDEEEDEDVTGHAALDADAEERRKVIMERVDAAFKQECVGALHRVARHVPCADDIAIEIGGVRVANAEYQYSLEELVSLTFDLVSKRERGIISLTTGIAQRISPNVKLRYWLAILASTDFPGRKLSACLDVIHKDLVTVWNFQDPNQVVPVKRFGQSSDASVDSGYDNAVIDALDWEFCVCLLSPSLPPPPSIPPPPPYLFKTSH